MEFSKRIAGPTLAAALGWLPYFLEKRGVAVPARIITVGGCLTIIAIAWALFWPLVLLSERFQSIRDSRTSSGAFVAVTLLAFLTGASLVWWISVADAEKSTTETTRTQTNLRLQFNAPGTFQPVAIDDHNIWYWQGLANVFTYYDTKGKEGKKISWTLFLVFDKPIAIKQLKIDSGGRTIPLYEVKSKSNRHVIIWFNDDLSGMVLSIEVETL